MQMNPIALPCFAGQTTGRNKNTVYRTPNQPLFNNLPTQPNTPPDYHKSRLFPSNPKLSATATNSAAHSTLGPSLS
jgi:hypothetical protein